MDDKVITEPDISINLSFLPAPVSPVVKVNPVVTCSAGKQPISSWGVKFNGNPKGIFYFLERISDLSKSRDVSEIELFNSAVELFVGDAFIWYRSIKTAVTDWNSLVARLKKDFLPPCSDDDIWENIRQKKQKRNETIVIFIAQLQNLFSRLSTPVCEATKLKYIRKNILPEYVQQLALQQIDSVETLSTLCRKLEEATQLTSKSNFNPKVCYLQDDSNNTCNNKSSFVPNSQHFSKNKTNCNNHSTQYNNSLPSTSKVTSNNKNSFNNNSNQSSTFNKPNQICFNCKSAGHSFRACKQRRKVFCYHCGEPNVKVLDCPKCSKN